MKEDRTRIRIFGKPEAHKGRRMGVVLCYGEVGDDVIIYGKLMNYKGNTPETVANKSYLYSLNGKTE